MPDHKEFRQHSVQLRMSSDEKKAFQSAAELAGISLSAWTRERLRLAAIRELQGSGMRVPFVASISMIQG